jgi:hypothetical protein
VHRPLAEVMVNPIDRRFVEISEKNPIQVLRGFQIVTERLLDDDPGVLHAVAVR